MECIRAGQLESTRMPLAYTRPRPNGATDPRHIGLRYPFE